MNVTQTEVNAFIKGNQPVELDFELTVRWVRYAFMALAEHNVFSPLVKAVLQWPEFVVAYSPSELEMLLLTVDTAYLFAWGERGLTFNGMVRLDVN